MVNFTITPENAEYVFAYLRSLDEKCDQNWDQDFAFLALKHPTLRAILDNSIHGDYDGGETPQDKLNYAINCMIAAEHSEGDIRIAWQKKTINILRELNINREDLGMYLRICLIGNGKY